MELSDKKTIVSLILNSIRSNRDQENCQFVLTYKDPYSSYHYFKLRKDIILHRSSYS